MNDLAIKECITWLELAIDQIEAEGDPAMAVVMIKKVLGILGSVPSGKLTREEFEDDVISENSFSIY